MIVKLRTAHEHVGEPVPVPGLKAMPDWYRKLAAGPPLASTAKKCSPMLDAFAAGYVVRLAQDVSVTYTESTHSHGGLVPVFSWATKGEGAPLVMDDHMEAQTPGMPPVFKWRNRWAVVVPEGYAVLWTHPINRVDLPFTTLSGMLDSGYESPPNLPFVWNAASEMTVPAGTPLAQAIPVKAEAWASDVEYVDDLALTASAAKATQTVPDRGYARHFRQAKGWS